MMIVKAKFFLLNLIVFLALGVMAYGVIDTGAWFLDSAVSTGSIITAGSLDLQVSGGPLNADNLVPGEGYLPMGMFCTSNTGSLSLKYKGIFKSDDYASRDVLEYLALKVEQQNPGGWATAAEIFGNADKEAESLLHYFQFPDENIFIHHKYIAQGLLNPGQEVCYRFSIKLDGSTPTEYQNRSLDYILYLYATQVVNPGW